MDKKLRIKTVLKKNDGDQKLFTYIFNRSLELCSYHYPDAENAKKMFEEKLLAFDLNGYDSYLNEFMSYLSRKDDNKDNEKFCLLFYDAVSVLKLSYKYCYENDNEPLPFDKLIGASTKQGVEITTVLQSLASLERLAARYYAGRVTDYFVNKERERKLKQHAKGGLTKAEKYREKMNPIFDEVFALFQSRKWKSKAECAKYFIKEFYLKNPDAAIELDSKKLVTEITNRINDRSTSRKVILLADR